MLKPMTVALFLTAVPALADVEVTFYESAPRDRFEFTNLAGCPLGPTKVRLDLAGSAGQLIFDTTASGAGVEVFQPFEVVSGGELLTKTPVPTDGDTAVELELSGLPVGAVFAFTIDVDDTLPASALGQIRVAGSEIEGAVLEVNGQSAAMTAQGTARVEIACVS